MAEPTVPDSHRDLLDAATAILATNGADGKPQVTAVAFLFDPADQRVKISLNDTRQKVKNLRRDPNATLFILDPANPYRTLEIRGRAELHLGRDQVVLLEPGNSWVVPKGAAHSYTILEPFTAVEATSPPAHARGRDEQK